jgi:ankyrin repeat protein
VSFWIVLLPAAGLLAAGSDIRLPEAEKKADKAEVRTLLGQHADVNARLADGATALHWAAYGTIWKPRNPW